DAPQWAAYWAVANQIVGTNLGQAAPTLFRVLRSEAGTSYANSFHDITTGSNGFSATVGYDKATGIGTPKFNGLYPDLQTLFAPAAAGCTTDTTQGDFQAGIASHVDLQSSPGDAKLALAADGKTTIFSSGFETGDSTFTGSAGASTAITQPNADNPRTG